MPVSTASYLAAQRATIKRPIPSPIRATVAQSMGFRSPGSSYRSLAPFHFLAFSSPDRHTGREHFACDLPRPRRYTRPSPRCRGNLRKRMQQRTRAKRSFPFPPLRVDPLPGDGLSAADLYGREEFPDGLLHPFSTSAQERRVIFASKPRRERGATLLDQAAGLEPPETPAATRGITL